MLIRCKNKIPNVAFCVLLSYIAVTTIGNYTLTSKEMKQLYLTIRLSICLLCSCGLIRKEAAMDKIIGTDIGKVIPFTMKPNVQKFYLLKTSSLSPLERDLERGLLV